MAKVEIYTTSWCPFCRRALALLDGKAVTYTNIDVEEGRGQKHAMSLRSGGRTTVPQVFINDQHIGGYEELQAVDDSGKLDALLQA
ncbi:MAG: glutaredoxin [Candidatus Synechococcus spongiarum 142]|uniref:Glutaredoxin n=1 Tax=Candidatus Synechococcus spongiarum 142 TaxID=1608213 RepID=A0A6N3X9Q2_9SYNE|nr:MAG: glutaredoxin [Candidatus Synechococcus spongiarum 142]